MKIVIVSLIAVLSFTSIISKFLKTEGSNSNYGAKSVEAVNSGYAKIKDVIVLTNDKKYRNPLIAMNLPLRKPIYHKTSSMCKPRKLWMVYGFRKLC